MNKTSPSNLHHPPEYFPQRMNGLCLFNKKPLEIPEDVLELIGKKGVREIHKKLGELVEENKKHFGKRFIRFFGLFYYQQFLDVKNRVVINVFQLIDNENTKDKVPYFIKKGHSMPKPFSKEKMTDRAIINQIRSGVYGIDEEFLKRLKLPRDYPQ